MAFSKIILNGTTLMDATTATAAASDIVSPKTAMLANGVMTTGTASGGGSNDFIVTISYNSTTQQYEPDCTFSELSAAYAAGKTIITIPDSTYLVNGTYQSLLGGEFLYEVDVPGETTFGQETVYYIDAYAYIFKSNGITLQGNYVYYDPLGVTATASDVVSGKIFVGANGYNTGTLQSATGVSF